ncbi:DUF6541 family protein [Corynebacterium freneyi]|uniref:DUF6541 family protein n=1 Tax=Corynebacterium freneyi TaxID=134034 RepID=UPI00068B9BDF|nr:DUF6541 family protein [Corynebacterium freneyi]
MIWPAIVLVLLLVVPGAILGVASGLRSGWALALGPALTFAVTGLAGWLYGAIDIGFSTLTAALAWAAMIVVALIWRRVGPKRADAQGPASSSDEPGVLRRAVIALPAVTGVLVAFVTLAWASLSRLARAPGGIESIQQSWDVHWHAAVIKYALDTGMVSSTRMGEIQNLETGGEMYYPAAWHAFGAVVAEVTGMSVPATTNILGLVAPALLLPVGAAALGWRMVDRRGWTASIAAGLAAVLTTALPVLAPIGVYVGAWPYLLGIALTGATFAVLASVPHAPIRMFGGALALIGIGQLHPSAVPSTVLLLGSWWLFGRVWRPVRPELGAWKSRLRDVGLLAAPGIVAAAFLLPQWLSASQQAEDVRAESATVDVDRTEAWYRAAAMLTRHAEDHGSIKPVIIVGLIGLVVLAVLLRRFWPTVSWLVSVLFTAHAINTFGGVFGDVLNVYTGLHYSTPHRLVLQTALLITAAGGAGVALIIAAVGEWAGRRKAASAKAEANEPGATEPETTFADRIMRTAPTPVPVVGLLVAAVLVAGFVPWAVHRMAPVNDHAYLQIRDNRLTSERDLRAFDWLAEQPEAHEHRVFTNPNEGSAWMYMRNDIPTVFRHFVWPDADKTTATSMVYWHTDKIGWGEPWNPVAANQVDLGLQKLDVGFIYVSPPYFWGDQRINMRMQEGAWWSRGLTPVYRDEEVTIYAVNAVIAPERIAEMREDSPMPMPPMTTRGEAGVAEPGDPDYDDPHAWVPDFSVAYRGEGSVFTEDEEQLTVRPK